MKNILVVVFIVFWTIIVIAIAWLTSIGSVIGIIKVIDSFNLKAGLTKAITIYFYFALIWIIYFVPKDLIKRRLIEVGNLDRNIKMYTIIYNIYGICGSFAISYLLSFLDSVFIFFLIMPVAFYGINKGIDEVIKMNIEKRKKYIIDSENNERKYGSDL